MPKLEIALDIAKEHEMVLEAIMAIAGTPQPFLGYRLVYSQEMGFITASILEPQA